MKFAVYKNLCLVDRFSEAQKAVDELVNDILNNKVLKYKNKFFLLLQIERINKSGEFCYDNRITPFELDLQSYAKQLFSDIQNDSILGHMQKHKLILDIVNESSKFKYDLSDVLEYMQDINEPLYMVNDVFIDQSYLLACLVYNFLCAFDKDNQIDIFNKVKTYLSIMNMFKGKALVQENFNIEMIPDLNVDSFVCDIAVYVAYAWQDVIDAYDKKFSVYALIASAFSIEIERCFFNTEKNSEKDKLQIKEFIAMLSDSDIVAYNNAIIVWLTRIANIFQHLELNEKKYLLDLTKVLKEKYIYQMINFISFISEFEDDNIKDKIREIKLNLIDKIFNSENIEAIKKFEVFLKLLSENIKLFEAEQYLYNNLIEYICNLNLNLIDFVTQEHLIKEFSDLIKLLQVDSLIVNKMEQYLTSLIQHVDKNNQVLSVMMLVNMLSIEITGAVAGKIDENKIDLISSQIKLLNLNSVDIFNAATNLLVNGKHLSILILMRINCIYLKINSSFLRKFQYTTVDEYETDIDYFLNNFTNKITEIDNIQKTICIARAFYNDKDFMHNQDSDVHDYAKAFDLNFSASKNFDALKQDFAHILDQIPESQQKFLKLLQQQLIANYILYEVFRSDDIKNKYLSINIENDNISEINELFKETDNNYHIVWRWFVYLSSIPKSHIVDKIFILLKVAYAISQDPILSNDLRNQILNTLYFGIAVSARDGNTDNTAADQRSCLEGAGIRIYNAIIMHPKYKLQQKLIVASIEIIDNELIDILKQEIQKIIYAVDINTEEKLTKLAYVINAFGSVGSDNVFEMLPDSDIKIECMLDGSAYVTSAMINYRNEIIGKKYNSCSDFVNSIFDKILLIEPEIATNVVKKTVIDYAKLQYFAFANFDVRAKIANMYALECDKLSPRTILTYSAQSLSTLKQAYKNVVNYRNLSNKQQLILALGEYILNLKNDNQDICPIISYKLEDNEYKVDIALTVNNCTVNEVNLTEFFDLEITVDISEHHISALLDKILITGSATSSLVENDVKSNTHAKLSMT